MSRQRDAAARGPYPVGVRTLSFSDARRGRALVAELWYPTTAAWLGRDLDPATQDRFEPLPGLPALEQPAVRDAAHLPGEYPLVAFSHGYSGHRRQCTALLTHLASHGYLVIAPDHAGGTTADLLASGAGPGSTDRALAVRRLLTDISERPADLAAALDAVADALPAEVRAGRVGVVGHSLGGWTALSTPAIDARPEAVVALAPSGGAAPTWPDENPLAERLRLDWGRPVSTLVVAAERDSILPLAGMRALVARLPAAARLEVLSGADHLHFVDQAAWMHELFRALPPPALYAGRLPPIPPIAELAAVEDVAATVRRLVLEHLEAQLDGRGRAEPPPRPPSPSDAGGSPSPAPRSAAPGAAARSAAPAAGSPAWPGLGATLHRLDGTVRRALRDARAFAPLARELHRILPVGGSSPARLLEEQADRAPDAVALLYQDERWTFGALEARANQWARVLRRRGVERRSVVALMLDNRPELLQAELGLGKLGAVAALVNVNLRGPALAHALDAVQPELVVVGEEHAEALLAALPLCRSVERADLAFVGDPGASATAGAVGATLDAEVAAAECSRTGIARRLGSRDPVSYVYTSGTTGLPKAAIITNQRFVGAAALYARVIHECGPGDVLYVTLPLYHSNAQWMGFGACLLSGATLALRRRFSASAFFEDVARFDATHFLYIGELCRYLLASPPRPGERLHRLRMGVGNGLRADVWGPFVERFRVPLMREFYGATEGNALIVNLEGRPGMIGRLRPGQALIACDPISGEPVRDARGLCRPLTEPGATGLLVARVSPLVGFEGYVDRDATARKLLHDVTRRGDTWFDSGDLLTLHEDAWVSFADRVGDTFRWKGENVSTLEVAAALDAAPGVAESVVYGVEVPGAEGRAGMAALRVAEGFDLDTFARHVVSALPSYQRPRFVRLVPDLEVTGTFKQQKGERRRQGWAPEAAAGPVFLLDDGRYVPLDATLADRVRRGERAIA